MLFFAGMAEMITVFASWDSEANVVDLRSQDEYVKGHTRYSASIPLEKLVERRTFGEVLVNCRLTF